MKSSIGMGISKIVLFGFCLLTFLTASGQKKVSEMRWEQVVFNQPDDWYGTNEAIEIADNVLLYQRNIGGWPKNTPMHIKLSSTEKEALTKLKKEGIETTIDNGATFYELTYLSKIFNKTGQQKYSEAFLIGINYLLESQYKNGGWPQFYPLKQGYYTHITYNDNAMINVLEVLKEIAKGGGKYLPVDDKTVVKKALNAVAKGIECILKTQYVQNGVLSVWCAQHDEITLLPAEARAYELPSLSGSESVGIVQFLMEIDNPSPEIINSVQSAVSWFNKVKISGIRQEWYKDSNGLREKRVVEDKNAPPIWARFYELNDNRPFFCDRDGIKKYSLAEIGHERRTGYGWYNYSPQTVLEEYPGWLKKWTPEKNVPVE